MQVMPERGPLKPAELLKLTPMEAALLEALRGVFDRIKVVARDRIDGPPYDLADDFNVAYCEARTVYLNIRQRIEDRP